MSGITPVFSTGDVDLVSDKPCVHCYNEQHPQNKIPDLVACVSRTGWGKIYTRDEIWTALRTAMRDLNPPSEPSPASTSTSSLPQARVSVQYTFTKGQYSQTISESYVEAGPNALPPPQEQQQQQQPPRGALENRSLGPDWPCYWRGDTIPLGQLGLAQLPLIEYPVGVTERWQAAHDCVVFDHSGLYVGMAHYRDGVTNMWGIIPTLPYLHIDEHGNPQRYSAPGVQPPPMGWNYRTTPYGG
ncbi:hypothetical protein F4818DRAFT_444568 [Hypoxylon cercidicola]|nr:hypothetical protein F4818DRAFT_444568 [Hypoxylon cercidicola]